MTSSPGTHDADPGFQIAPMVDVVFVLMLFFMACAGWQKNERELSASPPGQAIRQPPDAAVWRHRRRARPGG